MEVLFDVLIHANTDLKRAMIGAFLLLFIPTLFFFMARARAGRRAGKPLPLRPLAALEGLQSAIGRAAESGQSLHISLGSGAVGEASTAESLAGLLVLDYLAGEAATYDTHPIVTVASPTLLLAAQDRMRRAFARQGAPANYDSTRVRMIAPDKAAYAAGAMDIVNHEPLSGNVLIGAFGDEYLLPGEAGARKRLPQTAGAADPNILPYIYATTDQPLLGEEIFAVSAYLDQQPAHLGSLIAQDWMRILLVIIIIAGAIIYSVM